MEELRLWIRQSLNGHNKWELMMRDDLWKLI